MEQVIRQVFARIEAASEKDILLRQHKKETELAEICLENANATLLEKKKELADYRAETLKVIRGESRLSTDLLSSLVEETTAQIAQAQSAVNIAQARYNAVTSTTDSIRQEYDRLLSWADLYDNSSFAAKKMIASQFIKAVRVGKNYNMEIDFNVSFEEFRHACAPCPVSDRKPARSA